MTVGLVGLGAMGSAYAELLRRAGYAVSGTDISAGARERLRALGGTPHDALGDWVKACDVVIISVASPAVLAEVARGLGALLGPGQIAVETGTFDLDDKHAAREAVEGSGAVLLDCPVSGTTRQALTTGLLMTASGPGTAIKAARPILDALAKTVIDAGDFGKGSQLKYVANHLLALHNAAAAEALHYADTLGLDRGVVFDLLSKGAASSKMVELRMPVMMSGAYEPAMATLDLFAKDLSIIGQDLERAGAMSPLFDVARRLYATANDTLPTSHDSAAIFEVYRARKNPA